MAILGVAKRAMARRLIAWDRARVVKAEGDGFDCSIYKTRQDPADAYIDVNVTTWPQEVTFLFMALLEVTRTPTIARPFRIGRVPPVVDRLTLAERLLYRAIADDLGIRERLREVAPVQWGDVDTEGD